MIFAGNVRVFGTKGKAIDAEIDVLNKAEAKMHVIGTVYFYPVA